MTETPLEHSVDEDRRLLGRLRLAMLAAVTLTAALFSLGIAGAVVGIEGYRTELLRAAQADEARLLAAELAAEAENLSAAATPAHAMVARSRLLAKRHAFRGALRAAAGDAEPPPAAMRLVALSAALAESADPARQPGTIRALLRLEREEVRPALGRAADAALERASRITRDAKLAAAAMGAAGLALFWLVWRGFVLPGCRAVSRRTAALRAAARRMNRRMLHDGLTGLANRRHLLGGLESGDPEAPLAVLHLDIENFRGINADYGRQFGDAVLCAVAARLSGITVAGENVARMDADGFAIATTRRVHPAQLQDLAVEAIEALAEPLQIEGRRLALTAVIGIAARASGRDTPEALLINAEIACDRARREGGSVYFSADMGARLAARRQTATELCRGLDRGEIEPWFQPQIEAATGRLVGFEALVRWRHPESGILSPHFFLDIAEDARLGRQITDAMLAKALPALAVWREAGLEVPRIGVNLSLRELRDPALHDRLVFDLDRYGLAPSDLALEILESALIEGDDDPALGAVARLSRSGFAIDLDDFGTGHASLANLQRLAVDRIKIDRAFVRDLPGKADLRKVTSAMIHLAHSLGITTLAEGIETEAERAVVANLGCEHLQGFAIARPMPADDVPRWLAERGRGRRRRRSAAA